MKSSILNSLFFTLLLIFIISFPANYFITDQLSYYLFEIALRLVFLLYFYFTIRRSGRRFYGDENWKEIAILSPLFLICFSNMFVCAVYPTRVTFELFDKYFALQALLDVLTAFVEEIVFRFSFHNSLRISNRLVRIVASAGIFAAFHALNLLNGFAISTLIQIVYAFGLGLVLGFLYEYGHSIIMCIVLHFLFNFVNGTLFDTIFISYNLPITNYLIINGCVAGVIAIYMLVIFLIRYKKVNRLYFY